MAYTVVKTVTIKNDRLIESSDLTKPLSAYLRGDHFLVVAKDRNLSCLSIGRMLTTVPNLDVATPIGTAFTAMLTDLFVARYNVSTIPLQMSSGLYNKRLVVFNPLTYKNFDVYYTSVNTPSVRDDPLKKGFLDDLAIKSDEDMSNYLVAINGVFHRTAILDNVLYVLDGFRTIRLSGRRDILVVDTRNIGGHTIVPLTTSNVSKPEYGQRAVVTTPSSIQGKTAFAVIDGYFYHRDSKVLSVADQNHFWIHTNKLPLIQQFRHNPRTVYRNDRYGPDATQKSRKYDDAYGSVFLNATSVPTAQLANKDFQYSRLTAYHSFLVVMNNPNLFTVSVDILHTDTPKLYQEASQRNISGLLRYGCGLCPSYLIWADAFSRKSIFLSEQDHDIDRQDQSISPAFIPTLLKEPVEGVRVPAQFFDYVCA
jgi:hypothetical protein